jgi:hypothetical protein
MTDALELEPGEELHARTHVSFRGSGACSVRSTFALGSARMRARAYEGWSALARNARFPEVGPEMVLQLTNRRIAVRKASFWMGRPTDVGQDIDLRDVAAVAVQRHGLVVGLAIAMKDGAIVEVETMRPRRLRAFARSIDTLLAQQQPH